MPSFKCASLHSIFIDMPMSKVAAEDSHPAHERALPHLHPPPERNCNMQSMCCEWESNGLCWHPVLPGERAEHCHYPSKWTLYLYRSSLSLMHSHRHPAYSGAHLV